MTDEGYHHAAASGHAHVLQWLHLAQVPKPTEPLSFPPTSIYVTVPVIMLLGDIGCPLSLDMRSRLVQARRTFCAFHGCLRWYRLVGTGSRQHTRQQRDGSIAGTGLLAGLSGLPHELVIQIEVAAELQHALL